MFDYFGLSRELRDHIYEDALVPEIKQHWTEGFQICVRHFAATNLLLVSHRFNEEDSATAQRCCGLTFRDVGEDYMPEPEQASCISVPKALHNIRTIQAGDRPHREVS